MDAQVASRSRVIPRSVATDARWLETLHQICNRASHELKGALNGVAVNLEVVRSRAAKPDIQASAVSQFANAAVDQLDAVISMNEALLSLTRPAREPVDVALVVRHVAGLLGPPARTDGKQLELDGRFEDLGFTSANGNAVRLAVGASMLAAIDASTHVRCAVANVDGRPALHIEGESGMTLAVDAHTVDAARDAGIRIQAALAAISISFPD